MQAIVHPADIQDRDGGMVLLSTLFGLHFLLKKIFADGGYQGPLFEHGVTREMTQQNAAMVEQSTAASRALTHDTEDLARLTVRFVLPNLAA